MCIVLTLPMWLNVVRVSPSIAHRPIGGELLPWCDVVVVFVFVLLVSPSSPTFYDGILFNLLHTLCGWFPLIQFFNFYDFFFLKIIKWSWCTTFSTCQWLYLHSIKTICIKTTTKEKKQIVQVRWRTQRVISYLT